MEHSVLAAAGTALVDMADPFRLMMLAGGVFMGLFLGVVPGIGGLAGMALLLPFTYTMEPHAAFALLLGMVSVPGTSDTIPAVLFGVPGPVSAQATILDGNPMAKNGEAGRALSAAFSASLFGGLFGALLLAFTVPIIRPIMLHIGSPELLGFSVFGIAMVAVLSGTAPLRGLATAGFGVMLAMIGTDPQTGTMRFTLGTFYLWDGLPIVPLVLGLFAVPELADLAIGRSAITSEAKYDTRKGMATGIRDVFRHWRIVLRGGLIGAGVGAVPGLGASIVDWVAYAWALRSLPGATKTFGKGDVRGVIAPESANNAITAGALVPTIAFGVPGSATMAILLSVFLIHGLVPGPDMLTKHLDVTYAMVWSIAIANILGAGICFLFSGYLAKLAVVRYTVLLPGVLIFVFVGAFQASRDWGDLFALIIFALLGWTMKQLRWSRPPLVLGFVLGGLIERYIFISTTRYGAAWLLHPIVAILFVAAAFVLIGPIYKHFKSLGGVQGIRSHFGVPVVKWVDLFPVGIVLLVGTMLIETLHMPWGAKVAPMIVATATLFFCTLSVVVQVFSRAVLEARREAGEIREEIVMDTAADHSGMSLTHRLVRAAAFLGYLLLFLLLMWIMGLIPAVPVFVAVFMYVEGREKWSLILAEAVVLTLAIYVIFDKLLQIPWPGTLLGHLFPALTFIPSM